MAMREKKELALLPATEESFHVAVNTSHVTVVSEEMDTEAEVRRK